MKQFKFDSAFPEVNFEQEQVLLQIPPLRSNPQNAVVGRSLKHIINIHLEVEQGVLFEFRPFLIATMQIATNRKLIRNPY